MSKVDDFNILIGQRMTEKIPVQTVYATCMEVDWQNKTMTAIGLVDELPYYQVSLGLGSIYKKPKQGAVCLIGVIGNNTAATFLITTDQLEELIVKVDDSELNITPQGFKISRLGEVLKTVFNDMIDEINKIKVIYGNSIDVAAMIAIKQRLNTLLID